MQYEQSRRGCNTSILRDSGGGRTLESTLSPFLSHFRSLSIIFPTLLFPSLLPPLLASVFFPPSPRNRLLPLLFAFLLFPFLPSIFPYSFPGKVCGRVWACFWFVAPSGRRLRFLVTHFSFPVFYFFLLARDYASANAYLGPTSYGQLALCLPVCFVSVTS